MFVVFTCCTTKMPSKVGKRYGGLHIGRSSFLGDSLADPHSMSPASTHMLWLGGVLCRGLKCVADLRSKRTALRVSS